MTETTPLQRNDERRRLAAQFREVLFTAAEHRRERDDLVDTPDGPEMGWVIYERNQMHAATDAERAARGLPPVPLPDLLRVERSAYGHSDYAAQYAWGCALLVMDPAPHPAATAADPKE